MEDFIAESSFDCRDRDGNLFTAKLRLGRPTDQSENGRRWCACPVSLEPLFPEKAHGGEDTFQAICHAIELIRKALRAFVAHGGIVYFHGTRTPINIEDPSFCPIAEPINKQFLAAEGSKTDGQHGAVDPDNGCGE